MSGDGLEKVVRPFQGIDVFRARVLPPSQTPVSGAPEDVHTTWEGSADGDYVEQPPPETLNFKAEWDEQRSKRVSKKVKVVNPDDTDQHVFIERVDSFTFKNRNTGQEQKFNFDWSNPSDGGT